MSNISTQLIHHAYQPPAGFEAVNPAVHKASTVIFPTVAALRERGALVIKALQIRDRESLSQIGSFPCETILLDAYNPGLYGGTGETFPWELAVIAQDMFPEKRILLSGGLTPQNVRQAIEEAHPAAVDVASGVESAPGIKDLALVREFIEQARLAV